MTMAVSARQLFDVAEELCSKDCEVSRRMAASKAYYAVYHKCHAFSADMDAPDLEGIGIHRWLSETFVQFSGGGKYRQIGYMLAQCHSYRTKADYKIDEDFPLSERDDTLSQCRQIWDLADALS